MMFFDLQPELRSGSTLIFAPLLEKRTDPMKRTVEFYDSTVGAIKRVGESVEVEFTPAYVHQVEGEPGNERVTGWNLTVRLILDNATVTGKYPEMPCKLSDGAQIGRAHV